MKSRSYFLLKISQHLEESYVDIPALRKARPDIAAAFPALGKLEELERLLVLLEAGDLIPTLEEKLPRPRRGPKRKATKTPAEMLGLREQGQSLAAIAQLAGVTRQAVSEAIRKEELRRAMAGSLSKPDDT